MDKKFTLSLFIFRRDLRLQDNRGLAAALHLSKEVIPCFIFDERQVSNANIYKSNNALQFMIESLQDLSNNLKTRKGHLFTFHGNPEYIIATLLKELPIDAVFVNRDYTPFSRERDASLAKVCAKKKKLFYAFDDALLNKPETIINQQGKPYSIFTAFYKRSLQEKVDEPLEIPNGLFYTKSISLQQIDLFKELQPNARILNTSNKSIAVHGGRNAAQQLLKNLSHLKNYEKTRDYPFINTSLLSAHNKFGTLSIREVYYAIVDQLGAHHPLLRQLYWRDFFYHVAFHNPHIFGHPFHQKYENIRWSRNKEHFERWCNGMTGFPIVDAGMRQLNKTGFMHNRVRMIVASFLTKDLHINWQAGEWYFAQKLVDYDPCVNNGNWQWVASTGCDAQPYFRIFNPWLQQAKFDPEAIYIKTWIPELKDVPAKTLHNLYKKPVGIKNYAAPVVDHATQAKIAKKLYRKAK